MATHARVGRGIIINARSCVWCGALLHGRQRKYCGKVCRNESYKDARRQKKPRTLWQKMADILGRKAR